MRVIFQNAEDRDVFTRRGLVPAVDAVIIRGSGVNLEHFAETTPPPEPVCFLLIGRMLADKGVREFVSAARRLSRENPSWRFRLLGGVDAGNPSTLSREELESFRPEGIEWLGHRDDVAAQISRHHVIVLPSYREGMPKTLLEAAASGRPIITTDIPGCRDIVRDGVNGLLVPPRDEVALIEAMHRLGTDPQLRERMGRAGRTRAMAFSVEDVVEHTLRVYASLLREQRAGALQDPEDRVGEGRDGESKEVTA
jgi:glycosyltransferase involved in cell wall biosynthesis